MAENQEIIKKIRLFGLNTYEAKIWMSLLGRGVSTAGELSDIANVPRSRSYDVLESLEKKGFVVMKLGKPIKYLAVPPKEVLERVKKRIEKNTEKHLSKIKSTAFNNLINTFQVIHEKNTSQTENIVALLHGRKNIYKHIVFLLVNTKNDVVFSVENKIKDYTEITNLIKDTTKKAIKPSKTGVRMYVVGEDNAIIFPISEDEVHPDYDLGIWIKNKHTAKFLRQLLVSA